MASPRLEGRTGGVMAVRYDWRRTIAFIDQSGNETERARLRGLLGRTRPDARILRTLEALQNEDGGYPGELAQGRPSSVEATALVLGWMQDLSMLAVPQGQRAVTYLLTVQRPDGTWDESPGLLRYAPSPHLVPGDPRVQALCTALAASWLALLGYRQDHAVTRALAWLRARQAADGRFLGFLRTTWAAAAVFRLVEGAGSSTSSPRRSAWTSPRRRNRYRSTWPCRSCSIPTGMPGARWTNREAAHARTESHRSRGAHRHQPRDGTRSRADHGRVSGAMNLTGSPMRTLSLFEAAALLRMHPEEVRRRAKCGALSGAKPGRCWIFIEDDLADYVRSLYATPRQALQVTLRKEMECHFANAAVSGGSTSSLQMGSEYAALLGLPTKP